MPLTEGVAVGSAPPLYTEYGDYDPDGPTLIPKRWTYTTFPADEIGVLEDGTEIVIPGGAAEITEISKSQFLSEMNDAIASAGEGVVEYLPEVIRHETNEARYEAFLAAGGLSDETGALEEVREESDAIAADAEERVKEAYDEVQQEIIEEVMQDEPEKVRLAQQCILTALMDQLADKNSKLGYSDRMILMTDDPSAGDPDLLLNRLTKRSGEEEFMAIPPEVLSELVPYVRIYKVLRDTSDGPVEKTVEFAFDRGINTSDTNIAELVFGDRPNRGKGVGLKSVDWAFDGSDPYTSSRSIQVNLNFFFQSFEELNRPRASITGDTYRYLDLILQADCREAEQNATPEEAATVPLDKMYSREYYPECHEIKLVVGWSAPEGTSFTSQTPEGQKILEYIDDLKTTLWMTLIDHNFDIQQDGTFNLQANYQARAVGLTSDPRANIFIDPGPDGVELVQEIKNLKDLVEANRCHKSTLEKVKKQLTMKMKHQRQTMVSSIVSEMMRKNYLAQISVPTHSYVQMINAIRTGDLFDPSLLIAIDYSVSKDLSEATLEMIEATAVADEDEGDAGTGYVGTGGVALGAINPIYAAYKWLTRQNDEEAEELLASDVYEDITQDVVQFEYFYLGDLVEIIADRVLNPEVWAQSNSKAWRGIEYDKAVDKIKLVLGTLKYKFGGFDRFQTISLADVPISMSLFLAWMKDNVIDSEREEYPFIAFLNDAMTNLVTAALGSTCFEGLLGTRVKVRKTFFSSAASGEQEPFKASGGSVNSYSIWEALPDGGFAEVLQSSEAAAEAAVEDALAEAGPTVESEPEEVGPVQPETDTDPFNFGADEVPRPFRTFYNPAIVSSKLQQGLTSATDHYHYIMFFMDNTATRELLNGDYRVDTDNGIYHMKLGSNRGILKNASFNKTNQQFLREARFSQQTSEDYNPMAQLSNVYDVEFTTVGNNIWIPGKRIYFDPSSISPEGFGAGSYGLGKPHEAGSPAHLLGLGGYHMVTLVKSYIESGKFETVVTARWETGGGDAARSDGSRDDETGTTPQQCDEEEEG